MEEADKNNGKKRTAGRPVKRSTLRKKRVASIRFSEMEYTAVKGRASRAGLTFSAYCQSAILHSKIVEAVKKEDMDLLRRLSGEANNLNQLAHQANKAGLCRLEKEIGDTLNLFNSVIQKLSDDWKNHKRKKF